MKVKKSVKAVTMSLLLLTVCGTTAAQDKRMATMTVTENGELPYTTSLVYNEQGDIVNMITTYSDGATRTLELVHDAAAGTILTQPTEAASEEDAYRMLSHTDGQLIATDDYHGYFEDMLIDLTMDYTYDGEARLTGADVLLKTESKTYNGTFNTEWDGDNITKQELNVGRRSMTVTYAYGSVVNPPSNIFLNPIMASGIKLIDTHFGLGTAILRGKRTALLPVLITSKQSGGPTFFTTVDYEQDAEGNVTKMTFTEDDGITTLYEFTYDTPTAIRPVAATTAAQPASYNLSGQRLSGTVRGINLVKMSDGTVRKILSK